MVEKTTYPVYYVYNISTRYINPYKKTQPIQSYGEIPIYVRNTFVLTNVCYNYLIND